MKTIFTIGCLALLMTACSTTDTITDEQPGVTEPNSMKRQADMQGNITDGSNSGVNVIDGDTVIQQSDGHKLTVTDSDGDTTITPLPGVDTDTTKYPRPRKDK